MSPPGATARTDRERPPIAYQRSFKRFGAKLKRVTAKRVNLTLLFRRLGSYVNGAAALDASDVEGEAINRAGLVLEAPGVS